MAKFQRVGVVCRRQRDLLGTKRKRVGIAIPNAQITLEHGTNLAVLCEPALLHNGA
jgi:hypothetical protein